MDELKQPLAPSEEAKSDVAGEAHEDKSDADKEEPTNIQEIQALIGRK